MLLVINVQIGLIIVGMNQINKLMNVHCHYYDFMFRVHNIAYT